MNNTINTIGVVLFIIGIVVILIILFLGVWEIISGEIIWKLFISDLLLLLLIGIICTIFNKNYE